MAKMQSKYGVVELNNIASVRTGEIITQYKMASGVNELENGMLVVVDHYKQEIKKAGANTDANVYLHASVEKLYDGEGRKEFIVKKGSFLPRLYKLHVGDTFETNCVDHDKGSVSALGADITDSQGYGHVDASGLIKYSTNTVGGSKLELKALGIVTLPNGESGVKWRVVKAEA